MQYHQFTANVYSVKVVTRHSYLPKREGLDFFREAVFLFNTFDLFGHSDSIDSDTVYEYIGNYIQRFEIDRNDKDISVKIIYMSGIQSVDEIFRIESPIVQVHYQNYYLKRDITNEDFIEMYLFHDEL
ncbi:TPA: hypothetical protein ACGO10_001692 [Streptococcus suis]